MPKKPWESAHRASYERLRDACDTFEDRLLLGRAIQKGWDVTSIEIEAKDRRYRGLTPRRKRQAAIFAASRRWHYSAEQLATDQAADQVREAANAARKAIKATKATRPAVPSPAWAPIRAACASMLDCDRLQTILDEGWDALDVIWLARQFSEVVGHRKPLVATPAAIRLTLELIEHRAAGQYSPFLPRPQNG